MRALPAATLLLAVTLAGCSADAQELTPTTYDMHLDGMPTGPMAPGTMFNVTVRGTMGPGMGMHRMMTDHMGAHFWNASVADPTGQLPAAAACSHTGGEMPMAAKVTCTAPMQPGTYHLRAHARMDDGHEHGLHHYWGDEATFTVSP